MTADHIDDEDIELRVRELNHRFKNGVQMMIGVLEGARRRVADEQARSALGAAMEQVRAIADVQSIVSCEPEGETVAAPEFVQALCDAVRRSLAAQCEIHCRTSLSRIPAAIAPHLGFIINELVTNAVKHASSNRGAAIRVRLERKSQSIVLRVEDSGPMPGGKSPSGSGVGLLLVRSLVRKLAGEFVVVSRGGTRCRVTVPLNAPPKSASSSGSGRRLRATRRHSAPDALR